MGGGGDTAALPAHPPEMQNRRIIDHHLSEAGVQAEARLSSNSTIALLAHVASGNWAAILPEALAEG